MEIYILRHGIAEDARPGSPDSERALTSAGRQKLRGVLERARGAGVAPSLILTSPYRRAVETAQVAVDVLGRSKVVETRALLPDSTPEQVWEEIRVHHREPAVLLAGHQPLLGLTVAYLLGAPGMQADLKKAALVRIDQESFSGPPRGVLKWMLTPRLL